MQIFRKHPVFHPETAWIKPSFLRHNNSDAPLLKREAKFQSRVIVMAMNLPTILTGAAVTAAVGTAAYMMTGKKKNTAKQLKKKAGKAVQAVGDIVEGISNIMG